MADDNLPSVPEPTPPDLSPAPPAAPQGVTAAPAAAPPAALGVTTAPNLPPAREDAAEPPVDVARGLIRSVLHAGLGGVVGVAVGFLLYFIFQFPFPSWRTSSTAALLMGGGVLLGVAFSGSLVGLLGLTPRVRPGARAVVVGGEEGRSEIQLLASWLVGLVLVLVCGWGLLGLSYYLGAPLSAGGRGMTFVLPLSPLLSLGLFLLLEYRHWLSRLMGLRITPGRPAWLSAVFLWLFGIPGLLFRSTLAARSAPEPAKAAPKNPADAPQNDGIREVVETVVFVVVLVLLLKSFAAEAFVIPTGSMAETLLGYQKMVVCPQCGYEFPVNCSQQIDPQSGQPDWVRGCTCPNCRERIRFAPPGTPAAAPDMVEDPAALTGDRVLVAKFLYDLFERMPDRLDVVVFKYPGDDSFPRTGPFRDGVPMNYIKRLIGLSGETILIHNGNLYVLHAPEKWQEDDVRKKLREELNRDPNYDELQDGLLKYYSRLAYFDLEREPDPVKREELAKEIWQKDHMHGQVWRKPQTEKELEALNPEQKALNQLFYKDGAFQIIRKAPDNILAMRRIVYDNDHPARDLLGKQPPRWADRTRYGGWTADDAQHSFQLAAPGDDTVHWLGYRHLLRDMNDKPQLITDFMGYNTWEGQHIGHAPPGENWVGDLSLDAEVDVAQPRGELTLELSKGVDRFRARFDLATGDCKLLRVHDAGKTQEKEEELDHKPTGLKSGTHSVRFANVDERLTVWVDDALPFGDGVTYPPADKEGPAKENDLLEPAGVGVQGTAATVRGLKLYRDTYYTTDHDGNPGHSDAAGFGVKYDDPTTWDVLSRLPTKTLYIQPSHYLCLGDNSPESSDGRSWGQVPERLMLGKAIAVYYPFNRFGRIR